MKSIELDFGIDEWVIYKHTKIRCRVLEITIHRNYTNGELYAVYTTIHHPHELGNASYIVKGHTFDFEKEQENNK